MHTYTKSQTPCTRRHGPGWQIHGSVEDTKLSTNKQHTLSPNSDRTTPWDYLFVLLNMTHIHNTHVILRSSLIKTSSGPLEDTSRNFSLVSIPKTQHNHYMHRTHFFAPHTSPCWLHLCHTSSVRNTSDSRGPVTRKSSG